MMLREEGQSQARPFRVPRETLRRLAMALAGAAALSGWMLYGALAATPSDDQRLPDGSVLRLETVTSGKQHRFRTGLFLWGWLRERAPILQRFIPASEGFERSTASDALVAWFTRRGGAPGPSQAFGGGLCQVLDEHGCPYGDTSWDFSAQNKSVACEVEMTSYPRRARTFRLRLLGLQDDRAFEFRIPNPAFERQSFPAWSPSPLPITKRSGDRSFTLQRLTTWWSKQDAEAGKEALETIARFQVTRRGRPEAGWEATELMVADATGNRIPESSHRRIESILLSGLCPQEPAWKLRVTFARTQSAPFDPAEVTTLPDVPLPSPGAVHRIAETVRIGKTSIRVAALVGPGKGVYRDVDPVRAVVLKQPAGGLSVNAGGEKIGGAKVSANITTCSKPVLGVRVRGAALGERVTLQARDDQGRPVTVTYQGNPKDQINGLPFVSLVAPPGARRVRLTLAVHRSFTAEFMVKGPPPGREPDVSLLEKGPVKKGVEEYSRYLAVRPDDDSACNYLAYTLANGPLSVRDPRRALPLALRAVEANPEESAYQNTLGVTYYRLGEYRKAAAVLEDLVRSSPEGPTAFNLFYAAMACRRLGRVAEARDYYRRAMVYGEKHFHPASQWYGELKALHEEAASLLREK